jgi:hypothetical protein
VCRELVDGVVLVNNAAISGAIRDVYAETRTVLEPAGALAVAGARAYLQRHDCQVTRARCRVAVQVAHWPQPCAGLLRRCSRIARECCAAVDRCMCLWCADV